MYAEDQKWESIPNTVVPAMRAHASCVYKDSMYGIINNVKFKCLRCSYVFGGFCEVMKPSEFSKLYCFDIRTQTYRGLCRVLTRLTATKTWSLVKVKGTPPEGRSRCSMVSAQDCLYVFGGWNRVHSFADLHQFDIGAR